MNRCIKYMPMAMMVVVSLIVAFNNPTNDPMWNLVWESYLACFLWWASMSLLMHNKPQPYLSLAADAYIIGIALMAMQYTGLEQWPMTAMVLMVPAVDVVRWALTRRNAAGENVADAEKRRLARKRYAGYINILVIIAFLSVEWISIDHGDVFQRWINTTGVLFLCFGIYASYNDRLGSEARLPVWLQGVAVNMIMFSDFSRFSLITNVFIIGVGVVIALIMVFDAKAKACS